MDIEIVRTEALRKLGRNVINLAKIEAGLKQLLTISQFEGTPTTVIDRLRENQKKLSKQTLGGLVNRFNKQIVENFDPVEPAENINELKISLSFNFTRDNPDFLQKYQLALREIVTERNKLIHQDLANLDTTSIEDYRQLIELLDEQHPRLLNYLEDLRWMLESIEEFWKDLRVAIKSPEFQPSGGIICSTTRSQS